MTGTAAASRMGDTMTSEVREIRPHQLTAPTCKHPSCQEDAISDRGVYAYLCTRHKNEQRDGRLEESPIGRRPAAYVEGFENRARQLVKAGRRLDAAVAAKRKVNDELRDAMAAWKRAVGELEGGGNDG